MDWMEEIKEKQKRRNEILISKDSLLLEKLNELIVISSRKALVLWALELASQSLTVLQEKYPEDETAFEAIEKTTLWSMGKIKMPEAKDAILRCHSRSKVIEDKADKALYHAIGQACSVVHTPKHALGYPIYELTAIMYQYGLEDSKERLLKRVNDYCTLLEKNIKKAQNKRRPWASFIHD